MKSFSFEYVHLFILQIAERTGREHTYISVKIIREILAQSIGRLLKELGHILSNSSKLGYLESGIHLKGCIVVMAT